MTSFLLVGDSGKEKTGFLLSLSGVFCNAAFLYETVRIPRCIQKVQPRQDQKAEETSCLAGIRELHKSLHSEIIRVAYPKAALHSVVASPGVKKALLPCGKGACISRWMGGD